MGAHQHHRSTRHTTLQQLQPLHHTLLQRCRLVRKVHHQQCQRIVAHERGVSWVVRLLASKVEHPHTQWVPRGAAPLCLMACWHRRPRRNVHADGTVLGTTRGVGKCRCTSLTPRQQRIQEAAFACTLATEKLHLELPPRRRARAQVCQVLYHGLGATLDHRWRRRHQQTLGAGGQIESCQRCVSSQLRRQVLQAVQLRQVQAMRTIDRHRCHYRSSMRRISWPP